MTTSKADLRYQMAVDWPLNRQYPEDEARFWALVEGVVSEDEVDELSYAQIRERRAAKTEGP